MESNSNEINSDIEYIQESIHETMTSRDSRLSNLGSIFSIEENNRFIKSELNRFHKKLRSETKKFRIMDYSKIENYLFLIHNQTDLTTGEFKKHLKSLGVCLKTFEVYGSIENLRNALYSDIDLLISKHSIKIRIPKAISDYKDDYFKKYSNKTFRKYTSKKYMNQYIARKKMYPNKQVYNDHTKLLYPYLCEFLIHVNKAYLDDENYEDYNTYEDGEDEEEYGQYNEDYIEDEY